jgi:hypothetical protein
MSRCPERSAQRLGKTDIGAILQDLSKVALAATTWIGVTGLAMACFGRALPISGSILLQRELLGFTAAFAVAGAISGSISTAIYGRGCRAFELWLTFLVILAISIASTRWGIARLTGPRGPWFAGVWRQTRASLCFGIALGGLAGVVVSGIVAVFAALTRRRTTWTIGVVAAVVLAGMGFRVLPHVIPRVVDQTMDYAHWHYGWGYDEAILGACVGAGLGGLAGSVVMFLVAADSARRRANWARPDLIESRTRAAAPGVFAFKNKSKFA